MPVCGDSILARFLASWDHKGETATIIGGNFKTNLISSGPHVNSSIAVVMNIHIGLSSKKARRRLSWGTHL